MVQLDQLYHDIIMDHYKKPRGRGLREPFGGEAHHVNPTCGDEITVRVALDGEKITDVSYDGQGCSISQASASVLHEVLVNRTVDDALSTVERFTAMVQDSRGETVPDEAVLEDGVAFAGVAKYPNRVKCALLAWMAFKDATVKAVAQVGGEHE
jgi:nitrogen fixation NifU-like protein